MKRIIFATENQGKMREIRDILGRSGREVISIGELGMKAQAEETGETFSENAEIKAREIHDRIKDDAELSDCIVMADDSGFCIDHLGGDPGVHSARFMGHDTPYSVKHAEILRLMKDVKEEDRGARFVCVICAVFPDGHAEFTEGELCGRVAMEPSGEGGFGYDPIFYLPQYGKTTAELGTEFKNSVSHRARALEKMEELIEKEER